MAKLNQDFEIWQGDSKQIDISVVDRDGVAVDISNSVVHWYVFIRTSAVVTKSTQDGSVTIGDPTHGLCQVTLTSTDTSNLLSGVYYHEAHLTDQFGNKSMLLSGRITVHKSLGS